MRRHHISFSLAQTAQTAGSPAKACLVQSENAEAPAKPGIHRAPLITLQQSPCAGKARALAKP
eukprot:7073768-Pyramimonas_sp.AAC.1